jgi:hypothetical protein
MQRPAGVANTFILMCLTNASGYLSTNWQSPNAKRLFVVFTLLISIGYVVLWFYWLGRNWARWVVLVECLQCFWNLRYLVHRNPHATAFEPVMIVAEAAIAIYLVWYLNTPSVRAWFQDPKQTARL